MNGAFPIIVFAGLLLTATLAGCARTKEPSPDATSTTGTGTPTAGPSHSSHPMNGTAPLLLLHNVTVNVAFTSPGFEGPYAGFDEPTCDPNQPGVCWVNTHETIIPAVPSPLNGIFLDNAHAYADVTAEDVISGTWLFTGSIVGCTGSGTVTFPWYAAVDSASPVAPNANGEVVHGHDYLSAPANSTGFANIADAELDADYDISPVTGVISRGMLTGWMSCE